MTRRERRRARKQSGERPRRLTWRVALFVVLVLGVIGGAIGAVFWYGRNAYYVGLDGENVAIYRGRPGGLLWIEPELVETTDLTLADVRSTYVPDIEGDKEVATLDDAHDYIDNVQRAERSTTPSSTTTSTTPTTTAATTPAN
jgi:protein phosphatase